jgi:hypothetical protein
MIQIQNKLIWINLRAIGSFGVIMLKKVEDFEKKEMKPHDIIQKWFNDLISLFRV